MKKKITTTNKTPAKKSTAKSNRVTHVVFVVDRSGSMSGLEKATVDGFNEQLNSLKISSKKKNSGKFFVSAIKFDTEIEWMMNRTELKNAKPITLEDFKPRGGTALRDSQYVAIQALEKETDTGDTAFLIVTISDGGENSSKDISQQTLSNKIKKLEAMGNWTFTYMLANQNAQQFAASNGISINNIATFQSTVAGTAGAYGTMSNSLGSYVNSRSAGIKGTKGFYNGNAAATNTPPDSTLTIDSSLEALLKSKASQLTTSK